MQEGPLAEWKGYAKISLQGQVIWFKPLRWNMPKKIDQVIGDGRARSVMWNSMEGWAGPFKITCGSSTSITCNQDKRTIKDAQEIGASLSSRGLEVMANVASRRLSHLLQYWDTESDD